MEKRMQPQLRLQLSRTRALIHAFIIIFVLFSSNNVAGQSMEDLFNAMKAKEDVDKFSDDPKAFIKDKLVGVAKDKLNDAAFGPEMSPEMTDLFKRVSNKHDNNPKGGACPMAAHGNASSILFDLKYQGQTMWLPRTSLNIIGSILSVQKSIGDFLKDKAKDEIQDKLKKYFDGLPIETFSDTGTKQGCDFSVVATIDYGRKVYEVIIVANCKCQPIRIPLRKGSGVVEGWKLFASGPLTITTNNSFIKANLGRVKRYNFIPACNCNKDDNNTDMFSGSGLQVGENNEEIIDEPTLDCIELAKLISETEKKLDQIRLMRRDVRKRSKAQEEDQDSDDISKTEIEKLQSDYDLISRFMAGLLMDWNKYCGSQKETPKLSPLEFAHFKNALLRFNGSHYTELNKQNQQKHEERIKKAEKEESRNTNKSEKIGSAWSPPTGTTRIAAVGTVRNEKVMITSRGSIGGTVTLKDEDGEELAVAVPDEDGHFNIDFGDIGVAVASTLMLTRLDSKGKELTSTTVEYLPEIPSEIAGPPIVTQPEIPYLENNQIIEFEGENFGEGTEVVISDEQGEDILQETLSTSTNRQGTIWMEW